MIYSLRTFLQTGLQEDEAIGRKFQTIYKDSNKEEFEHHWNEFGESFAENKDLVYGLLISDDVCLLLYKAHRYYIVTEHGNTYANITFRK